MLDEVVDGDVGGACVQPSGALRGGNAWGRPDSGASVGALRGAGWVVSRAVRVSSKKLLRCGGVHFGWVWEASAAGVESGLLGYGGWDGGAAFGWGWAGEGEGSRRLGRRRAARSR